MDKRITCIATFKEESLLQIDNLIKGMNGAFCKIPYGAYDEERKTVDTLPFHITLSAWDSELKNRILRIFNSIIMEQIIVKVNEVKIMNGKENSFVLYLGIEKNERLIKLIYEQLPNEKYNPEKFEFHITLDINKDYEKIVEVQNKIAEKLQPFEMKIDRIKLFEIYPVSEII